MAATTINTTIPTPLENMNPLGSTYASTYSHEQSALLMQAIERQLFDLAPKQYDPMKILNMLGTIEKPSDEFIYMEKVRARAPYTVSSWTHGTGVLVITGTFPTSEALHLEINNKILNASGEPFVVKTVTHSTSADTSEIVVSKVDIGSGTTLAADDFAAGEIFIVSSKLKADGMDEIGTGNDVEYVERYNYFELFERAQEWTELELLKMKNNGTTDIMDHQKMENMNQLRDDLFSSYFAGTRGEGIVYKPSSTSTTYKTKTMHGIINMMIDGGSEHSSPTLSGLKEAFQHHAFSTNKKAVGGTRIIMARDELLTQLADLYKGEKTRYEPNSRIANLNLYKYTIGTMNFVPVNAELFSSDAGVLPAVWNNRILVLDINNFKKCKMKGYPYIYGGTTDGMREGSEKMYRKWWLMANTSLQANGVNGSFYLDVQM